MALTRRQLIRGIMAAPPVVASVRSFAGADRDGHLQPTLMRVHVPVPGLDRRLDGMRIGQISDAHIGAYLGLDHLQEAVKLFERNPPDLMVVTGDLLDDASLTSACLDVISQVRAPYGHLYSMGNHENYAGREQVMEAARGHSRFKLLVDEGTTLSVQNARFHALGIDYPTRDKEKMRMVFQSTPFPHVVYRREFPGMPQMVERATLRADEGDFRLALCHHPDFFDSLREKGVDLTLSGHTHGGQVAPWGTRLAKEAFHYALGLYSHEGRHVYVNGGTGHWYPLRVGVPAEVTELTLHRV